MKKYEKPKNAVSGYYLPESFTDDALDAIKDADDIEASDDFVFGFITALAFVSNQADAETHGLGPVEYIENAFNHYDYDVKHAAEVVGKIADALKSAGFDVRIDEATMGGDR